MGKIRQFLLGIIFPSYCLLCQKNGNTFICPDCQVEMALLIRQVCPYCGEPSLTGQVHSKCRKGWYLEGLVSAFVYRSSFKKIITQVKFEPYLFSVLEELTTNTLKYLDSNDLFLPFREFVEKEDPVVIPIPLHRAKQKKRGFNQAQIIAKIIAREYNLALEKKLLTRIKDTKPQYQLDEKGRKKNLKNAFKVSQERIDNCLGELPSVLLVDDIWTTGTTMKNAARVLKKAGIGKIWGLTLAQ